MGAYQPPRCARCGYDRTGLRGHGVPARCPECGSRRIDLPWRGWRAVLLDVAAPVAMWGVAGYAAVAGMALLNWEAARVLRIAALGAVGVLGC